MEKFKIQMLDNWGYTDSALDTYLDIMEHVEKLYVFVKDKKNISIIFIPSKRFVVSVR